MEKERSLSLASEEPIGEEGRYLKQILMNAEVPPDRQLGQRIWFTRRGALILLGIAIAVFLYVLFFA
jgi:hypothetical protein